MNIRKNIDNSEMNEVLEKLMAQQLSQIELIANIAANAQENIALAIEKEVCYIMEDEKSRQNALLWMSIAGKTVWLYYLIIWSASQNRWNKYWIRTFIPQPGYVFYSRRGY